MRPSRLRVLAVLAALLLAGSLRPSEAPAQEGGPVAPFVPTPMNAVVEMLELAGVSAGDTVYDLGSGDGRLPIAAARLHGARGVGVELDSALVTESRDRARQRGVGDRVRIIRGDLFETDLTGASVVTLYLFPEVNERLRPRLLRQLDPGDRVVAHDFAMGEWEPDSTTRVPGASAVGDSFAWADVGSGGEYLTVVDSTDDPEGVADDLDVRLESLDTEGPSPVPGPSTLYLWIIPADLEGDWSLELPDGRTARIRLDQRFQEVRAAVREGPFTDGSARVRGTSVRLELGESGGRTLRLLGTYRDGRLEGRTSGGGRWSARRIRDGDGSVLEWEETGTGRPVR